MTGRVPPTLEAYCNSRSEQRCSLSMKGDEFLEASVETNHIWLQPPHGHERQAIAHYLLCREKDQVGTSAIIILPSSNGRAMPWTQLLKGMVLLTQIPKGERIFTSGLHNFGLNRITEIWWDPPIPLPPKLPKEARSMFVVQSSARDIMSDMVVA